MEGGETSARDEQAHLMIRAEAGLLIVSMTAGRRIYLLLAEMVVAVRRFGRIVQTAAVLEKARQVQPRLPRWLQRYH